MFCPKCGTENGGTNRFCLACGGPLVTGPAAARPAADRVVEAPQSRATPPPLPADQSEAAKQCPVCAKAYPAAQRFCNADGATLVAAIAEKPGLARNNQPSPPPDQEAAEQIASKSGVPPPEVASAPTPPEPALAAEPEPELSAAPAMQPASSKGLICPSCGLAFPVGVRFCDQDGSTLVERGMATNARVLPPVVADLIYRNEEPGAVGFGVDGNEDSEEYGGGYGERRSSLTPALIVGILLILTAGGGYAYWSGMFDKWLGKGTDRELARQDKARPEATSAPKVPGLLGSYKAHIADQDIVLTIASGESRPLVTSAGTVTYLNAVNGGTCTALLVPISGGGIGGDTGNAVSFRQSAVPGKPACPKDIPIKMDISSQPSDDSGVVRSIAAEWRAPNSEKILMAGTLERDVVQ